MVCGIFDKNSSKLGSKMEPCGCSFTTLRSGSQPRAFRAAFGTSLFLSVRSPGLIFPGNYIPAGLLSTMYNQILIFAAAKICFCTTEAADTTVP